MVTKVAVEVIFCVVVLCGCKVIDTKALEDGKPSSDEIENKVLHSKMEYLENQFAKQQTVLKQLNDQIEKNANVQEDSLDKKLKLMEEVILKRFDSMLASQTRFQDIVEDRMEGMSKQLNIQNEQIANVVKNQDQQEMDLVDKFAWQNQLWVQRSSVFEEAIGKLIDRITDDLRVFKQNFDSMFSNLRETHNQVSEHVLDSITRFETIMHYKNSNSVDINEAISIQTPMVLNDTRLTQLIACSSEKAPTSPVVMLSCSDVRIKSSGVYKVKLFIGEDPVETYCEKGKFPGGWIVIQHRFNGSVDFYRNWVDYKVGFGDLRGEFFIGLEMLHQLTKSRKYDLLIELKKIDGKYSYALYRGFEIGSDEEGFSLKHLGQHSGTADDSMWYNRGKKFSTKDNNNVQCATEQRGGWWYGGCGSSNLNGPYVNEETRESNYWYLLNYKYEGLKMTKMMIKEA